MDKKIYWYERVLLIVIYFLLFTIMTFTAENFIVSIQKMIELKKFDIRFTAGNNSHFGQWILALFFVFVIPLFFKLLTKLKITNLWLVGLITTFLCFLGEFLGGVVLNIWLKMNVWDYSFMEIKLKNGFTIAFHLFGQINIFYIPVWFFSIIFCIVLYKALFGIDVKFVRIIIQELKNIFYILFVKGGNTKAIDEKYFDIRADYLEKETKDIS